MSFGFRERAPDTSQEGRKNKVIEHVGDEKLLGVLQIVKERQLTDWFSELARRPAYAQAVKDGEKRLVDELHFAELGEILQLTGNVFPLSADVVPKTVETLFNDGLSVTARECIKSAEQSGIAVEPAMKERVFRAAEREEALRIVSVERKREFTPVVKRPDELVVFFYPRARIQQFSTIVERMVRERGIDLPFSARLNLREVQHAVQTDIRNTSDMLTYYLFSVIDNDLSHQTVLEWGNKVEVPSLSNRLLTCPENLYHHGTEEQQVTYLRQAAHRFGQEGWPELFADSYGGKMWKDIAEATIRLVKKPGDVTVMDGIFQLHHTNDNVLVPERPALGVFDEYDDAYVGLDVEALLTVKRDTIGNSRILLQAFEEHVKKSSDMDAVFDEARQLIDRWSGVLDQVARAFHARGLQFDSDRYL